MSPRTTLAVCGGMVLGALLTYPVVGSSCFRVLGGQLLAAALLYLAHKGKRS